MPPGPRLLRFSGVPITSGDDQRVLGVHSSLARLGFPQFLTVDFFRFVLVGPTVGSATCQRVIETCFVSDVAAAVSPECDACHRPDKARSLDTFCREMATYPWGTLLIC